MKRRGALALALCLTTIVGFFIVAYGTHIGFFGGRRGADDAAAQANPTAEPTPPPAPAPPAEPQAIEEIVYQDVVVSNPGSGSAGGGSGGGSASDAAPQSNPTAPPQSSAPPPAPASAPEPAPGPAGHDVEFGGQVTSVSGSTFIVDTRSGEFTVRLDASTSVHGGEIEAGASVKVHGYQGADGVVTAKEVEVEGED